MKPNLPSLIFICLLFQSLFFLGQAVSCEAGNYAENDICLPCGDGKSSLDGALSINDCQPCADKGCKTCKGLSKNACSVCDIDYFLLNSECVSSNGGSPGTPYTCVDKGCLESFGNNAGQCSSCDVGYYLENNQCVLCGQGKSSAKNSASIDACSPCDDYPNCQVCSGLGPGQCVLCQGALVLINGSCESSEIQCEDSNCVKCSRAGTAQCSECKVPYKLISGKCYDCVPGDLSCLTCDDKNCELCNGKGTGQCFSCEANYYLNNNNECTSCSNGKYSFAGSLNSTDCFDCEDENCITCEGPNIGRCITCLPGFQLISGTCKLPGESVKINNKVSASIRYDMTITQFNEQGGKNYFIAKLSRVLSIDIERIFIKSVRKGSVIVDYAVALSGDESDAKIMKKTMDEAVPAGQMNFYGGKKVLNYGSEIEAENDGSDEKKGSKVPIIAGVIGGAVCIAVVISVWKRFAMMKAQRASFAETKQVKIAPYEDSIEKTFKTDI